MAFAIHAASACSVAAAWTVIRLAAAVLAGLPISPSVATASSRRSGTSVVGATACIAPDTMTGDDR